MQRSNQRYPSGSSPRGPIRRNERRVRAFSAAIGSEQLSAAALCGAIPAASFRPFLRLAICAPRSFGQPCRRRSADLGPPTWSRAKLFRVPGDGTVAHRPDPGLPFSGARRLSPAAAISRAARFQIEKFALPGPAPRASAMRLKLNQKEIRVAAQFPQAHPDRESLSAGRSRPLATTVVAASPVHGHPQGTCHQCPAVARCGSHGAVTAVASHVGRYWSLTTTAENFGSPPGRRWHRDSYRRA